MRRLEFVLYRLVHDTAWQPVPPEEFDSSPVLRKAIILGYGPIRPWLSIAHWYIFIHEAFTLLFSVYMFT